MWENLSDVQLGISRLFMVSLCKTFWQAILAQAIGMGLGEWFSTGLCIIGAYGSEKAWDCSFSRPSASCLITSKSAGVWRWASPSREAAWVV